MPVYAPATPAMVTPAPYTPCPAVAAGAAADWPAIPAPWRMEEPPATTDWTRAASFSATHLAAEEEPLTIPVRTLLPAR